MIMKMMVIAAAAAAIPITHPQLKDEGSAGAVGEGVLAVENEALVVVALEDVVTVDEGVGDSVTLGLGVVVVIAVVVVTTTVEVGDGEDVGLGVGVGVSVILLPPPLLPPPKPPEDLLFTLNVFEVPVFVEVCPVTVMDWDCAAVNVIFVIVAIPPVTAAVTGVAPLSALPKVKEIFSFVELTVLPKASTAVAVKEKAVPISWFAIVEIE
jgi:hypothetical protein